MDNEGKSVEFNPFEGDIEDYYNNDDNSEMEGSYLEDDED